MRPELITYIHLACDEAPKRFLVARYIVEPAGRCRRYGCVERFWMGSDPADTFTGAGMLQEFQGSSLPDVDTILRRASAPYPI